MVSRVVLIRHGDPENAGQADEKLRSLSAEGKIVQRRTAEKLQADGIVPRLLFSSPILRAVQTAEIVGDVFKLPVHIDPGLGYEFDSKALVEIMRREEGNTLIFVGHAPTLPNFANLLLGPRGDLGGIPRSGFVVIDFPATIDFGEGHLVAQYHP